jgi:D-3-phosphoglycerate dehydrogenase
VLVIEPVHDDALALLDARSDVDYEVIDHPSPDRVRRRIVGADAVTVRASPITVDVLAAAPKLRVVSRHGVGYDNVPVDYCTGRGIAVTVVGNVNAVSVAEHTMFLMLAAARAAVVVDGATRAGDFGVRGRVRGVELRGRTLLLVGCGRIGTEVAARAAAFGMNIVVHDPYLVGAVPAGAARAEDLDDALRSADVVSLHVPLTEATHDLLDAAALDVLPPGAIVVNAARGGLIDEDALVERVRSGRIHGAGLDVFADEPLDPGSPLTSEPRIVLSAHTAALTEESLAAMGVATIRNVLAAFDGELDPALVVNPAVLSGARAAPQGTIVSDEEAPR